MRETPASCFLFCPALLLLSQLPPTFQNCVLSGIMIIVFSDLKIWDKLLFKNSWAKVQMGGCSLATIFQDVSFSSKSFNSLKPHPVIYSLLSGLWSISQTCAQVLLGSAITLHSFPISTENLFPYMARNQSVTQFRVLVSTVSSNTFHIHTYTAFYMY